MAYRSMWELIFALVTSGSSDFHLSFGVYGVVGVCLSRLASWQQSGKVMTTMTMIPNMITTGDGSTGPSRAP